MYHIIVNPYSKSGLGKKIWEKIEPVLTEREIRYQVVFSKSPKHVSEVIRRLTEAHAEKKMQSGEAEEPLKLIILGGDGTLNEVINSIADFNDILVGYIPTGSSNDFARDLELPKDPLEILDTILKGETVRKLDIGNVHYDSYSEPISRLQASEFKEEHRFDVSAGIGFDAAVCEEALVSAPKTILNRIGLGKLTYLVIALRQVFGSSRLSCDLILDDDSRIHLDHMLFIAFMIHRYEGGGFKFCPEADATDGIIDLCVVGNVSRATFLIALPSGFKGTHYRFNGIDHYRAKKAVIHTEEPLWVHTDGEVSVKSDAITVTCSRQALRMLM